MVKQDQWEKTDTMEHKDQEEMVDQQDHRDQEDHKDQGDLKVMMHHYNKNPKIHTQHQNTQLERLTTNTITTYLLRN